MKQIVTLLQHISQTAFKTHETVKTIATYCDDSKVSSLTKLNTLLSEIQAASISTTYRILASAGKEDVQENIHTLFINMDYCEELFNRVKEDLPNNVPANLKERLEMNIGSLKDTFIQLTPHIRNIYGEDDCKNIISGSF